MRTQDRCIILLTWIAIYLIAFHLLFPTHVYADDCLSDPLNGADCMRTGGFRQAVTVLISLGGALAVILGNVLTGLVAGAGPTAATVATSTATTAATTAKAAATTLVAEAVPIAVSKPETPPEVKPPAQTKPEPGLFETAESGLTGFTDSPWWDLTKNTVGPGTTIIGSLSEFFDFKESADTVQKLHESLRAWQNNPTKEAAEKYLKTLNKTTNMRLKNLADSLDFASKAVDVVDAVGNGLKKASERGFTGVDKTLTVGAELGKKGLTWVLTKNPVVGLVDSALGGATEMIYGKEGRIDIGGTIDKGANAWDKTTQEYFENTQGLAATDADIQTQDQFLHGLRRIKDQVNTGKLTPAEGGARARHLRDVMFGGKQ